ncbi:MAG: hypothetical protein RLZZ519_1552 [Bacteroidota bacterium]|jgi:uncharacterized protein (TIGR02646 family)
MEQIRRRPLSDIPELAVLQANWEQWGREFETYLLGGKSQGIGVNFSWRLGIREPLRTALEAQTASHCSFCDAHPVGESSDETIEHYEPKVQFPLHAYKWENLFYCCRVCQNEANAKDFVETLRPDVTRYEFDRYFYFDLQSGKLKVMENLLKEEPAQATLADLFLRRYGINDNPKRCQSRKHNYTNIKHALSDPEDGRTRDDFPYRFVYDCVLRDQSANL